MSETFPITFGRYVLLERLAVGGMAEIFRGQVGGAHGFEKTVVIKRLLPHMAGDAHINQMFINEAKLTARLAHPKIAQTYELGRCEDQLYIAMEYVDGLDVLAMLRESARRRSRIPLEAAVYIAREVLDALDFAHGQTDAQGKPLDIIHRDISPSNILVSRRGDVKLVDFGIARAAQQDHRTQAGTLKGKYGYMSPEQVVDGSIDSRSDLFSLGVVLSEMATGRRLFAAPNELDVLLMVRDARLDRLDKFGGDLDPDLDRLIRKALRKDLRERYQSAAEFRDALDEWMFEKRFRVTPAHLGELVLSLYDEAWSRKREAGPPAGAADRPAPAPSPAAPPRPPSADPNGIPRGELEVGDSMPILTLELDEAPAPPPDEVLPEAPPATGIPKPIGPEDSGSIPIELEDLQSGPIAARPAPRPKAARAPTTAGTPASRRRKTAPEPDLAAPSTVVEGEESLRYPSIEAAVASLSATAVDPSAIDFDDREVSAIAGQVPHRPRPLRLPTAEELAAAKDKKPPELGEIEDPPDQTGDLAVTPAVRVFYQLAVERATGLLVVTVGGIRKEIYVVGGKPEFVSSNVARELFGEYLIQQKVLSEGELSMALAVMPHYGGKLGDTLVGLGLLKPLEVFRHLTRQVREKLIDVCTWAKGSFAWYEGRPNPREAFPLDLQPFEILGAGAMQVPRGLLTSWAERLYDRPIRSAKNEHISPRDFAQAGVRAAYDSLDGSKTIGELAARYDDDEERARFLRIVYLLVYTDLARLG